jgi:mRNA interferase RelE/StbE
MRYGLEFTDKAMKQYVALDGYAKNQIARYLDKHFGSDSEAVIPHSHGKPLTGKLKGYWRYATGKYRLICEIHDSVCLVLVIKAGHRRDVNR